MTGRARASESTGGLTAVLLWPAAKNCIYLVSSWRAVRGESVTFLENRRGEPRKALTWPVDVFLQRLLRHVPPHTYRTLRSCGLYAPNAGEKRRRARSARRRQRRPHTDFRFTKPLSLPRRASAPGTNSQEGGFRLGPRTGIIHTEEVPGRAEGGTYNNSVAASFAVLRMDLDCGGWCLRQNGGYAVGYYGYPRATHDMDIWIAVDPVNAEKMVDVMTGFGFAEGAISKEVFLRNDGVVRMGVPPLRLEIKIASGRHKDLDDVSNLPKKWSGA